MPHKLASRLTGLFLAFVVAFVTFGTTQVQAQNACTQAGGGCYSAPSCSGLGATAINGGSGCGNPIQVCCSNPVGPRQYTGYVPEIDEYKQSVEKATEDGQQNIGNLAGNNVLKSTGAGIFCALLPSPSCPDEQLVEGGSSRTFVGSMGNLIAGMMTEPPAKTDVYIADVLDSAGVGIAQPAYAQGIEGGLGFNALTPILEAWKTFRNLAYLFFVLIFLAIGFMIMFRQKIGSQTVVTAQQAIPQIIVALLAVTFSYAIAGLLIDLMYLFMALMIAVFDVPDQSYLNLTAFSLGKTMITGGASLGYDTVSQFIDHALGGEGALGVLADGTSILGGIAAAVIIAIAITIGVFRLFLELLKTYISIIISITMSPLILMMEALPGRKTFTPWVKGLIGNLAAFPTVLLLLIIFDMLVGGFSGGSASIEEGGFSPPFLIGLGGPGAGVIPFIVGLGMLLIMTEVVQQVKKALGAGGGIFDQFTQAYGDSLKRGWTGGELIPGLAFTDTSRYGISGRNILSKPFFGTAESRKAADEKVWHSRGPLGRGALGALYNVYKTSGSRGTQSDITEKQYRDVPRQEKVPQKRDVEKSGTVGL